MQAFVENVKTPADAMSIIGKFGVGFYSAFMVADKVDDVTLLKTLTHISVTDQYMFE